jgi:predicted RNA binding protein YcfA (HicA-like mRNA interferase family)
MMGIKVRELMSFIDKKCKFREVIKILEDDGGYLARTKGSHR